MRGTKQYCQTMHLNHVSVCTFYYDIAYHFKYHSRSKILPVSCDCVLPLLLKQLQTCSPVFIRDYKDYVFRIACPEQPNKLSEYVKTAFDYLSLTLTLCV